MSIEILRPIESQLTPELISYLSTLVFLMPFSQRVRGQIRRRAKGRDEISGEFVGNRGQASHWWHGKEDPNYNKKENGFWASAWTHLLYHIFSHGNNGLSERDNKSAITLLVHRHFEGKPMKKKKGVK